jgi:hypothetical protein
MLVIDPPAKTKSCEECSKGQQLKCEVKGAKLLDEKCEFYEGENVYGKISFMQNEDDTVQEFEMYKTSEEVEDEFNALPKSKREKYTDFKEYGEDKYAPWEEDEDAFGYMCNPNSVYDWCEIGGRWDGLLVDKQKKGNNSLYVKDFDPEEFKKLSAYSIFFSDTQEYISKEIADISGEEYHKALPEEILGTIDNKINMEKLVSENIYEYSKVDNKYTKKKYKIMQNSYLATEMAWDILVYKKYLKDLQPNQLITIVDYHN